MIAIVALNLLLAGAADVPGASAQKFFSSPNGVPGRYIVVLDDDYVAAHGMKALTDQVEARRVGSVRRRWSSSLRGFAIQADGEFAGTLAQEPWVRWVEQDQYVRAVGSQTGASWGLDRIDQRDQPLNGTFNYAATGGNVNVYIIDSGVYAAHPYFEGRAFGAYTAIYDTWGTDDGDGHGTMVAGIVASNLFGAAKTARIYSVRVLDANGEGYVSDLIDGVEWVTYHHVAPSVANVSVAADNKSSALDLAVAMSVASGVTYVVAAGNDNGADSCQGSPAGVSSALTVAASTVADAVASYSNVGACVDLFAPGSSVYSTCAPNRAMPCPNGLYTYGSGTSFAAPYVAAIAAQYLAMYPAASPSTVASAITSNASTSKLSGVPAGTSNRLLFAPPVCQAPTSACGWSCKNLSTDRGNCGACGNGCGTGPKCFDEFGWYYAGTTCQGGSCVANSCE